VNREDLLVACFGRADWPVGDVVLQVRAADDVLSHLDLYWRTVGVGSAEIPVAAIGQVATEPAFRGLGLASGLVQAAHLVAKERGLQWAALFGVRGLYRRLGYVTPPGAPRDDLLVCPLAPGLEWPPGPIDTRGEW
jgi:predicted N-acetyltransferase YhbS